MALLTKNRAVLICKLVILASLSFNFFSLVRDLLIPPYGTMIHIGPRALNVALWSSIIYLSAFGVMIFIEAKRAALRRAPATVAVLSFLALNITILLPAKLSATGAYSVSGLHLSILCAFIIFTVYASLVCALAPSSWVRSAKLIAFLFSPLNILLNTAKRTTREQVVVVTLNSAAVVIGYIGAEVTIRLTQDEVGLLEFRNFATTRVEMMQFHKGKRKYDPILGWIMKPNVTSDDLNTDARGLRLNGQKTLQRKPGEMILVTGDSFSQGSNVRDEETWPAVLEQLSGFSVANAAIGGWGMDQAFLRLEQLIPILRPKLVIYGFIDGDIIRNALSVYAGAGKPYYAVLDGKLHLQNVPVPSYVPSVEHAGLFKRIFGYSYLIDRLARIFDLEAYWYVGNWEFRSTAYDGVQIGCLLMKKLRKLSDQYQTKIILYPQYAQIDVKEKPKRLIQVLNCAQDVGLKIVDPYDTLYMMYLKAPIKAEYYRRYWLYPHNQHHNPNGEHWSGTFLYQNIRRQLSETFADTGNFSLNK